MSDLPGNQSYRIFLQWIDEQGVSKDGPAVLCHLGLLLSPDRARDTGYFLIYFNPSIKTQIPRDHQLLL